MASYRIAPSLLAADFGRLADEVAAIEAGADLLHLDVMDGHFVPNISFGLPVIASLRRHTSLPFDCHLMTTNPDSFLPELAAAGVDMVTMHIEAIPDPTEAIKGAAANDLGFGLAISPPTPFSAVIPFMESVNMLLVMSVNPGFGGQSFTPDVLPKVQEARNWIESHGLDADIQIDGGVSSDNIISARNAGATVFVAGTSIFGAPDPAKAIRDLRKMIEGETWIQE